MKKVISVVGARPNFMKVAPIDKALGKYANIKHLIVHTGQHYDKNMSDAFFQDLDIPQPDYFLGVGSGTHAEQTAKTMIEFEKVLEQEKPDLVIVVGDVNSTIACSLTAVKSGIQVAHVEGGLRSYDRAMPEEINRMATDAICDYCFATEPSAVDNLISENFPEENIFLVGNTMIDSQHYALKKAAKIDISNFGVAEKEYVLVTLHRPSNVDFKEQLEGLLESLIRISEEKKVFWPVHPRARNKIKEYGFEDLISKNNNIIISEPLGYLEFLALMRSAALVMTDSGGIQEETTALQIPCLTLRTSTERPITIQIGSNKLIDPEKNIIIEEALKLISGDSKKGSVPEFWDGNAAKRIAEIISKIIFEQN